MERTALQTYLDNLLGSSRFRDYCPNGLQVEGRGKINKVICGVTACQGLIDQAIVHQADAILVHHGWFWKSEDGRVTGFRRQRMASLLAADINLFAYHLPLDAHAELGNNAQLAQTLGWRIDGRFGEQDIGFVGCLPTSTPAGALCQFVSQTLGRTAHLAGSADRLISRVAWCSGGAQGYFEAALATGADLYLSGEISEQTTHLARETGMAYIAAGHHATERYGVQALGEHLHREFGLDCQFIDIENPV
ncbi:MAG: Nif3-like dinuclear metal center hexameric protein [Rhodocyclaceae bacterium]|jgi:dinuclear metal center YbgI/SA1388 family protein|nr:Nif3-like dinuclear metal center hexameric protein [Rhodocyclaceae bacterium]